MKTLFVSLALAVAILGNISSATFAKTTKMAAATLKCPVCSMPMPKTKTAMMKVPVYAKSAKTVYYCCPMCKAGQAGAAYMKKNKKPMPV